MEIRINFRGGIRGSETSGGGTSAQMLLFKCATLVWLCFSEQVCGSSWCCLASHLLVRGFWGWCIGRGTQGTGVFVEISFFFYPTKAHPTLKWKTELGVCFVIKPDPRCCKENTLTTSSPQVHSHPQDSACQQCINGIPQVWLFFIYLSLAISAVGLGFPTARSMWVHNNAKVSDS